MKIGVGYQTAETVTAVIRGERVPALHIYFETPEDPYGYVMFTSAIPRDQYDLDELFFYGGAETSSEPAVLATVQPREVRT